jgi:GNAT superfamily N-acetyltransferase
MDTTAVDSDLSRADAIERAAWTDLFRAAPFATRRALGLELAEVGDALALTAAAADHPLLNRAIGATAADLAAIAAHYDGRGVRRYFVHVHRAGRRADNDRAADRAGLVRYHRAWCKLARGSEPAPEIPTGFTIEPARASDMAEVGALYCAAFDLPAAVAPMIEATLGRAGWDLLVARDRDRPVAFGLLFSRGEVGYMAGGGTAPAARRRGAQGALLAARIARARARGCRWMASETGEAVPGDPQHSYRNMERCGFVPIGTRDNYTPAGTAWGHGSSAA